MIQVVSFDVGDTLLRPFPSFGEVVQRCCADAGETLPPDSTTRLLTLADAHFARLRQSGLAYSLDPNVSRQAWSVLYRQFLEGEGVPLERVGALTELIYRTFLEPSTYRLFDDALPALRACRERGFRVGVVSNWEAWLPRLLRHLEIDHLLDFTVVSGIEGREKPDPGIFEVAAAVAGVSADRILHVGDSLTGDVHAAEAAGFRAVLLDRTGRHDGTGVRRVSGLLELLDLPELLPSSSSR